VEYVSLYRRWRPQKFAEVVGQRHVVLTLQRALAQGRVGHAYLFAGPRGTGKTTVARILAKAINCRRGPAPEPCLECDMCQSIAAGSCLDVIEMDAASNRGVDEIRHLREHVGLAPAQGRSRVYIVDEVHMLTTEAFNALLKTLEEPPRHVLFVLATTEPHRLPLTIASRCQRFEFRRLDTKDMLERLREVARQEGIPASDDALGAVARYAEGSLRDAISLLDQLMAYAPEGITPETVWAVLGRAPLDMIREMGRALAGGDAAGVLNLVEQASVRGLDMRQVLRDLAAYLRDLSVLASCGDGATLLYLPPGEVAAAREELGSLGAARCWELASALARADAEVRWTSQPRLALELVLLRLVTDRGQPATAESGGAAVALPESRGDAVTRAGSGGAVLTPAGAASTVQAPTQEPGPVPVSGPEAAASTRTEAAQAGVQAGAPAGGRAGVPLEEVWQQLLSALGRSRRWKLAAACLREGRPLGLEGKRFVVGFPPQYAYHREQIDQTYRATVEEVLARMLGYECRLVCVEAGDEVKGAAATPGPGEGGRNVAAASAAENGVAAGLDGVRENTEESTSTRARAAANLVPGEELDEVIQRAWREWGGYILNLEGEGRL
jgi:DNA polymerase-3 subunit gamma/tau